jgi:hypothetical protein
VIFSSNVRLQETLELSALIRKFGDVFSRQDDRIERTLSIPFIPSRLRVRGGQTSRYVTVFANRHTKIGTFKNRIGTAASMRATILQESGFVQRRSLSRHATSRIWKLQREFRASFGAVLPQTVHLAQPWYLPLGRPLQYTIFPPSPSTRSRAWVRLRFGGGVLLRPFRACMI